MTIIICIQNFGKKLFFVSSVIFFSGGAYEWSTLKLIMILIHQGQMARVTVRWDFIDNLL